MTTTVSTSATQKQIDYILSLAGVRYLSELNGRHGITLTMRERSGQISKAEASRIIDTLKAATGKGSTSTYRPAARTTTYRPAARRSCITGGNCSSFGTGRSCGAHDCDGY